MTIKMAMAMDIDTEPAEGSNNTMLDLAVSTYDVQVRSTGALRVPFLYLALLWKLCDAHT